MSDAPKCHFAPVRYQQCRALGTIGPIYGNVQARVRPGAVTRGGGRTSRRAVDLPQHALAAKNEVFNGELQADCLERMRGVAAAPSSPSSPRPPPGGADSCYLHEVPAPAALALGAGVSAPQCDPEPLLPTLTNEQCNVVVQLQRKIGAWWAPFRESTPKFFAADPYPPCCAAQLSPAWHQVTAVP